jgi:hypothetical protein
MTREGRTRGSGGLAPASGAAPATKPNIDTCVAALARDRAMFESDFPARRSELEEAHAPDG